MSGIFGPYDWINVNFPSPSQEGENERVAA